ncbi:hypothetical protein D3C77_467110 [compost metagenome]
MSDVMRLEVLSIAFLILIKRCGMSEAKGKCPTEMYYSYHWAGGATACSTDSFPISESSQLQMKVEFKNETGKTISLGRPQLWVNSNVGDGDAYLPDFACSFFPEIVKPGEKFALDFLVDTADVPVEHKFLTVRPQLLNGGWYSPLEVASPLVDYAFSCQRVQKGELSCQDLRIIHLEVGRGQK